MNLSLLVLFISLLTMSLQVEGTCRSISMDEVKNTIENLKELYYPQLHDIRLEVRNFKSKNYYLKTNINVGTLLNKPEKRLYYIEINPKLLACAPTEKALEAILVHELKHIEDMATMRTGELLAFLFKYGTNKKFIIRYEHETDEKALGLGHAEGLKEYRHWIYAQLSEKSLAKKRATYYTPEEIDLWLIEHSH